MPIQGYVELQATSHFSFLRGASSCEEMFSQAARRAYAGNPGADGRAPSPPAEFSTP